MAHLKKFSLASKLAKLKQQDQAIYQLVLFGSEQDEDLFYSTESLINFSLKEKNEILNLSKSLDFYNFSYLSANQVSMDCRAFVMKLCNVWNNVEQSSESLIIINPQVEETSISFTTDWEVNQSFPFLKAQITRYDSIKMQYVNLDGEDKEINLSGFQARVAQQALDCLNGYQIIDPRLNLGRWDINDKWKNTLPKLQLTLDHYKIEIQKLVESHPNYFKLRTLEELNKRKKELDEQFSFEDMLMKRLSRYVKKEMLEPVKAEVQTDNELFQQIKNQGMINDN